MTKSRGRMLSTCVAIALTAMIVMPAGSQAASLVQTKLFCTGLSETCSLVVFANGRERNSVTVTRDQGSSRYIVRDEAGALPSPYYDPNTGPNPCYSTSLTTVECVDRGVDSVIVRLGAGDDRVELLTLPLLNHGIELYGDSGDDVLIGSDYGERIDGGSGRDVLRGRGGADGISTRDGERDRFISCGSGGGAVSVDRIDPRARNCVPFARR